MPTAKKVTITEKLADELNDAVNDAVEDSINGSMRHELSMKNLKAKLKDAGVSAVGAHVITCRIGEVATSAEQLASNHDLMSAEDAVDATRSLEKLLAGTFHVTRRSKKPYPWLIEW